jgi:hypothetical protein
MFGSEILDVVIGMIFVYLLWSLICVQWHLCSPSNVRAEVTSIASLVANRDRNGRFDASAWRLFLGARNSRRLCGRSLFLERQFQVTKGLNALAISNWLLKKT